MRIDQLIAQIEDAHKRIKDSTFNCPPQDFATFKERLGFYAGLGECLRLIREAMAKDMNDDD